MSKDDNLSDEEKIALGICVSPLTVDRCPYCIDICEASHWKHEVNKLIEESGIFKIDNNG